MLSTFKVSPVDYHKTVLVQLKQCDQEVLSEFTYRTESLKASLELPLTGEI